MSDARRTLLRFFIFLLITGAGAVGYVLHLEHEAAAIDNLPTMLYEQPMWSQNEEEIAYLANPVKDNVVGGTQLWRCPRVSGEPFKIGDLAEPMTLLGWVNEDRSLLLQPKQAGGVPRVLVIEADGSNRQEIRFEREGLELIGARGGEIFFQRKIGDLPYDAATSGEDAPRTLTHKGVDILTWAPGKSRFTKLVSVPDSEEDIHVEDALPSPNGRWVALTLRLGGPQGSLGLWLYDKKADRLNWTNIRVEATAMRLAWSGDSVGLVAAAEMPTGCDLFALWDVESSEFSRLKSSASRIAYRPFWPRGERAFLLLDGDTVYRFEPDGLHVERILSRHDVGQPLLDLAISPRGTWAVFHCREGNDDVLYRWSRKTKKSEPLLPPDQRELVKNELWYRVAEGLRYATQHWLQ